MKKLQFSILLFALLGVFLMARTSRAATPGDDFSTAIRIVLGQNVSDIGDRVLRPAIVYVITLERGQEFRAKVATDSGGTATYLLPPGTKTFNTTDFNYPRLAFVSDNQTLDYTVPVQGDYYILIFFGKPGLAFTLSTQAVGVPIDVPPPPIKDCIRGPVLSITYSLLLGSLNLPDEIFVDGNQICAACTVKPPVLPIFTEKFELAYKTNTQVEACYSDAGQIVRLKIFKLPPPQ